MLIGHSNSNNLPWPAIEMVLKLVSCGFKTKSKTGIKMKLKTRLKTLSKRPLWFPLVLQLYRIYIDYIECDQLYKTPHIMDQMFFADVEVSRRRKKQSEDSLARGLPKNTAQFRKKIPPG